MFKQMMNEFVTTWKACDVNKDGVLKRAEFLNFIEQNTENNRKRFGEARMGDSHENNNWYDAYNLLTPTKEGVSMEDFRSAMEIIRHLIIRKTMEPLMREVFLRMRKFKKETMAKIQEEMKAEEENPELYKKLHDEFVALWKECDANNDGVLTMDEFKVFNQKNFEKQKARWGESRMPPEDEVEGWYRASNMFTPSKDGISLQDFE